MHKKPDLEMKLFGKELTLMEGESLGPYTCGATDPAFRSSEVYVNTSVKLGYQELMDEAPVKAYSELDIIKTAIKNINDTSLHELSHKYSKCGHNNLSIAQGLRENPYIRVYAETSFEEAIGKILCWCI